jgi:hypothetical protein
MSDEVR